MVDAVLDTLPVGPREQLFAQVQAINRIQRFSQGKEVNLYCLHHGRPAFPEGLLFHFHDEVELARVTFTAGDGITHSSASVRMVNGRLFSMVFAQAPVRPARRQSSIRVTDVRLGVDPTRLEPDDVPAGSATDDSSSVSRSMTIASSIRSGEVPPLQPQTLVRGPVDARLPADYLQVLDAPVEAQGFVIHDPEHLRLVALDSFNCYILAERHDRVGVGIIQGRDDGGLYAVDFANGSVRPVGHSLIMALRTVRAD